MSVIPAVATAARARQRAGSSDRASTLGRFAVVASARPNGEVPMPFVEITLTQGRSPEQLRTLITRLTDAAVTSLDAPRDTVRVVVREVPATHYAAGDVTLAESRRER